MKHIASLFSVYLTVVLAIPAQTVPASNDRAAVQVRVDDLSRQLRFTDAAGERRYEGLRDQVTKQVRDEIDGYVERSVPPAVSAAAIATDLRGLVAGRSYDTECSGPVFASVGAAGTVADLVIGYALERGGAAVNDSNVSIRAYGLAAGAYRLADETGTDMEGYGLFMRQLPSPVSGQEWFLAWGPLFGFNGSKTRVRVYAFDGDKFRTVWSPEDVFNAAVNATFSGFSIRHRDKARYDAQQPPYDVLDEYIPFGDGIRQVNTQLLPN